MRFFQKLTIALKTLELGKPAGKKEIYREGKNVFKNWVTVDRHGDCGQFKRDLLHCTDYLQAVSTIRRHHFR